MQNVETHKMKIPKLCIVKLLLIFSKDKGKPISQFTGPQSRKFQQTLIIPSNLKTL
jgi:hypothetical protein